MTKEEQRERERSRWRQRYADPEFRKREAERSRKRMAEWLADDKNRERYNANRRKWYLKNREKVQGYNRKWREKKRAQESAEGTKMIQLRNKKTGEIGELHYYPNNREYRFAVLTKDMSQTGTYKTLGAVLQDWEGFEVHTPVEPLIKDEKVRKAVRAWAEANGISLLLVIKMAGRLEISDGSPHLIYISFRADDETMNNLNDRTYYPIAELCGDEE